MASLYSIQHWAAKSVLKRFAYSEAIHTRLQAVSEKLLAIDGFQSSNVVTEWEIRAAIQIQTGDERSNE